MPPTLQNYIDSTRRLLGDNATLYSQTTVIACINEARHQRDLDTRLVRKIVGFPLVTNQVGYPLATVQAGTFLSGETTMANARGVASIYVLPTGGVPGGIGLRYPLGRRPLSYVRYLTSTSWPSYPTIYAVGPGPGIVTIAVPPAQTYQSEWDLIGIYPDLVQVTDVEPMPDPYNDPLPYLAAAVGKYQSQRFDEGQVLERLYKMRAQAIGVQIQGYSIPDPGFDLPSSRR